MRKMAWGGGRGRVSDPSFVIVIAEPMVVMSQVVVEESIVGYLFVCPPLECTVRPIYPPWQSPSLKRSRNSDSDSHALCLLCIPSPVSPSFPGVRDTIPTQDTAPEKSFKR